MTTRRDQPFPPFDVETDESDVTEQFWGSSRGWVSHGTPGVSAADTFDEPTPDRWSDDSTGALRAIRDGVRAFRPQRVHRSTPTGQIARTRQHGAVRSSQAPAPRRPSEGEASLGELASGWTDEFDAFDFDAFDQPASTGMNRHTGEPTERHTAFDEGDLVPLSSTSSLSERIGLGAVDPLLLRMGMLILVGLLLIPLALVLRPASQDVIEGAPLMASLSPMVANGFDSTGNEVTASDPTAPASGPEASGRISAAGTTELTDAAGTQPVSDPTGDVASASVPMGTAAAVAQSRQNSIDAAAGVSAVAEREVPACPSTYVAGPGDSWYRIAAAADITPTALFAENGANADTVIFPGDPICLPAGAAMPSPPTTTPTPSPAPSSTAPSSTTEPPSTTTTQPAAPPASQAEVQQIIRDVWPDELEERALEIAQRESNFIVTAHNGTCCYGVFQLYWSVHRSWLDDFGIYSATDLFDAGKNVRAAYGLYQRAGGWGPWGG